VDDETVPVGEDSPAANGTARRRLHPGFPQNLTINLLAITVGIATAFGTALFILMMRWCRYFFFDVVQPELVPFLGSASIIFIPVLGGLLMGPIVTYLSPEARGSGVPQLMMAIDRIKGRVRARVIFSKIVATVLTLSSGGSAGREGPIIQIGGSIGAFVARLFAITPGRTRWLIASGCAAGIAVLFDTPIAGTIFAMEVIVGDYAIRSFASIIFAAVAGSVVGHYVLGPSPSFLIPSYKPLVWHEYGFFLVLGLLAAVAGLLFVKLLYATESVFTRVRIPAWLKPAVGGLGVGIVALWAPQIMDTGYSFMNQMLKQEFLVSNLVTALVVLLVLKIVATSLTVGSGGSGGVFAPSVFIGGTLGAAIGNLANRVLDTPFQNPGAYALVGMAAVLGATIQAPFTAMIMIVEMTNDYSLVMPLMLAVTVATLVYNHYLRYSAFTLKLHQLGVHRRAFHDVNVLEEIQVGEIMHKDVEGINEDTPYDKAYHAVFSSHHNGFPVVDREGLLVGIITEGDFGRHIITDTKRAHEVKLKEIMCTHVKSVYPDMSVWEVHKLFDKLKLGRFPVVSRDNPRKIIGIVTRSDIVHAYPEALKRHEIEFEI